MSKGTGAQPFLAGAVVAKKYRLLRSIGEGAMGVVWHARNETTGGDVALKLIVRPERELRVRLLDEAKACCAIRHKNVVQVHDVGETASGDPFLVMELLTGETLADMLARRRRLEVHEAAAIARDVARAIAAIHEKGIVHRDLKPANVFLHHAPGESAPVVKVLDFGVSKNLVGPNGVRTVAGATVGSPFYMSPEQALADAAVDGRTDVWSLGAMLFEMLAGVRPFDGEGIEVLRKVVYGPIPLLWQKVRRIPPELSSLVTSCLLREREQRPWPASEIACRLARFATAPPGARSDAPHDCAGDDARTHRIEPSLLPLFAAPQPAPVPVRAAPDPARPAETELDGEPLRPTLPSAAPARSATVRLPPELLAPNPSRGPAPTSPTGDVLPSIVAAAAPVTAVDVPAAAPADNEAPGASPARLPRGARRIAVLVAAVVAAVVLLAVVADLTISRKRAPGGDRADPEPPEPGVSIGLEALRWQTFGVASTAGVVPPHASPEDTSAKGVLSRPPARGVKPCNPCGRFPVSCCPKNASRKP